ncbi:DUF4055 domain-containing protein, partial [Listeria monocytogenes]|uniref:DUF4055 domain-containing protein n=1 Tax=Listeria monocytogenes TaxID=1639 RepID=UPI002FDBF95A
IKYLEHTGAATSAGEAAISKLEAQMLQSGAELLIQRPQGQRTATESNNDAEANKSDLQRIAEVVAYGIDMCLQFMADWVKEPQGGHIKLFSD